MNSGQIPNPEHLYIINRSSNKCKCNNHVQRLYVHFNCNDVFTVELSQSSSKSKVNIPTGINTCNNRDYDLTEVVNLTAVNLDTRTLIG